MALLSVQSYLSSTVWYAINSHKTLPYKEPCINNVYKQGEGVSKMSKFLRVGLSAKAGLIGVNFKIPVNVVCVWSLYDELTRCRHFKTLASSLNRTPIYYNSILFMFSLIKIILHTTISWPWPKTRVTRSVSFHSVEVRTLNYLGIMYKPRR